MSDGTRAWRAIRAPLAWGCEMGAYDAQRVAVGVVDWTFDTTHVDLDVRSLLQPSGVGAGALRAKANIDIEHGTRTAGILAATGDNGTGIAGMLWESDLHLFALANAAADSSVTDASIYLRQVIVPAAIAAGVRVLVSSIQIPGDFRSQAFIDLAMRTFVNANPGNLFIQAVGNDSAVLTVAQLLADEGNLGLQKAAAALLTGPEADHVLLAAGTNNAGQFWPASNFFTGVTEIAAPATDILSLSHRLVNGVNSTSVDSGTSNSAPFVGGVAGMLLAMDPTLTAAEVKDYLLRGAREPRLNTTGQLAPPAPVANAPEPVYQLDAYGALTLLSRERPNTPLCGMAVSVAGNTVVIDRPAPPNVLPIAGATSIQSVSVAPGGRLIAASTGSQVFTVDHRGNAVQSGLPLVRRVYLERDTLDLLSVAGGGIQIAVSGPNGVPAFDPVARVGPSDPALWSTEMVAASPFGDWLAVRLHESSAVLCEATYWYLLPVSGTAPVTLVTAMKGSPTTFEEEACNAAGTTAGWSHDGQRVVITIHRGLAGQKETGLRNITIVNGLPAGVSPETTVVDRWLFRPRFTADDSLLVINEQTESGACRLGYRVATNVGSLVLTDTTAVVPGDCTPTDPQPPTIFNTRVAGSASARSERSGARRGGGR